MSPSTDRPAGSLGRVLVTDGEFKHTLGIVRRLADLGYEVELLARSGRAPAVHSNAVSRWHRTTDVGAGLEARLLAPRSGPAPHTVIPVGSGAMAAADRLRDRWPAGVRVALPTREAFALANDKAATAALARSIGLRTPREHVIRSRDELRAARAILGLPLVLKSAREEGRKVLRYVRSEGQLDAAFAALRSAGADVMLAQELIAGDGYGFCALYWNGALQRRFMHRRVREWPPTGGASVCAESVTDAPELERAGRALLDALKWHGVAMVEFKGSLEPGALTLIEINAKFWGSHDLALAAEVDFPGDLAALLAGRALAPQQPVRSVRFAWPWGGDLWHAMARPASLPAVLWDAIAPGVAHNYRLGDPLPHVYEALQWARSTPGALREARELQ